MKQLKDFFFKLKYILTGKQRRQFAVLFIMLTISAFLELLGVSMMLPFIQLIVDAKAFAENPFFEWIFRALPQRPYYERLLILSGIMILVFIVKNVFMGCVYYYKNRFIFDNQKEMTLRLYEVCLQEPYYEHIKRNSASILRGITSDILDFFTLLMNVLVLFAHLSVCLVLVAFLVCQDVLLTGVIALALLLYFVIFIRSFKKKIQRYGERSKTALGRVYQDVQESFGGIKEVKAFGLEEFYLRKVNEDYTEYSSTYRKYYFGLEVPRLILETVCVLLILTVVTLRISNSDSIVGYLPTLGVFAMALFRMFPRISEANECYNKILFFMPTVEILYQDLQEMRLGTKESADRPAITLEQEIEIEDICFGYSRDVKILDHVNMSIKKGEIVALVGASGEGKTTLVDLLLGMLIPQSGRVLSDGVSIHKNIASFRQKVGYIPQNVYLTDGTIRDNVALGMQYGADYTDDDVYRILKIANLDEFVKALPEGLDTMIGEQGVRLSGGQKQRLGIARALMVSPSLLILDEATSALDEATESGVVDAICNLRGKISMVVITHRIASLKGCDVYYKIKDTKIHRTTYESIVEETEMEKNNG